MIPLEWSEEGRVPLFAAYAKAQADMGAVVKDAANPAFKSKYASLANVVDAVLPALNANGLAVIQSPSFDGEVLTVETMLIHAEGGYARASLAVRPGKPDAQGIGSAITYLRRYALMSIAGVAPEDDDGNAASANGEGGKRFTAPEFVTPAEAAHLEAVADEVGARKVAFLKAMGVTDFDKFLAKDYDKALAALERKRQQTAQTFRGSDTDGVAGNARELEPA